MRLALYLSMAAMLTLGSSVVFSQEAGKADAGKSAETKAPASAASTASTSSTSGTTAPAK
ncbi:MAG: hypothetical protein HY303_02010 [Candidatus Wallbacteria bacterium]|nr:hypothetical protein [Candidatus Wallbacteria bacterium]